LRVYWEELSAIREKSDRPAGLRTNILVCLGATVFTLVSYLGFENGTDLARIAAGVVTGIGFIGAGVIFRQGPFLTGNRVGGGLCPPTSHTTVQAVRHTAVQ